MLSLYWLAPSRPWSLLSPPTGLSAPPSPELQAINAERLREDLSAVNGLAATSVLSIATGAVGALRAKGARSRAFHVTTVGVHLFVLGTAVVGRAAIELQDPATLGTEDSVQRGARLLRLLGAGIASDVGAMLAGALALKASKRRDGTLAGAGTSLLLHGAMLLLVDTALFLRNAFHQRQVVQSVAGSS
ncbi:hypothetical protein HPC49_27785 [Pyxidicoccus fallax]|uniref:Uncharacterized protein n=1 Tax=Pyxidicoccus fallax TaxID=394095 RepID=A0A848LR22_9BACT|nr:hypothetical protein [Pyxidicoccus fallax]NMO19914.1 hypothetical protein [Pyxidicoccus fallax]NPC82007.1 hypothetical protein [Pyxidicoccus fallax]